MTIYVVFYIFCCLLFFLISIYDFHWGSPLIRRNGKTQQIRPVQMDASAKWKKDMKWYVILTFGALIVLLGLRAETMGYDLLPIYDPGYLPSFESINQYSWMEVLTMDSFYNYEKGYVIFNKLVGSIWVNRQFFMFVIAIISIAPVGICVYKYSSMPLMSVIVYLGIPTFMILFGTLRQAIAVGITMLSFIMIRERKPWKFILLVLLASTFHSSAVVFLAAYPIYHIKLSKHAQVVALLLLPVIWAVKVPLFSLITKILYGEVYLDDNGAITLFLIFAVIYLFGILYGNRSNPHTSGLMNLFWVACAVQAVAGVYSTVNRVGYYYVMYLILLLPEIYEDMRSSSKPWQKKILIIGITVCFMLFGYYQIMTTEWSVSCPYVPFWNAYK